MKECQFNGCCYWGKLLIALIVIHERWIIELLSFIVVIEIVLWDGYGAELWIKYVCIELLWTRLNRESTRKYEGWIGVAGMRMSASGGVHE